MIFYNSNNLEGRKLIEMDERIDYINNKTIDIKKEEVISESPNFIDGWLNWPKKKDENKTDAFIDVQNKFLIFTTTGVHLSDFDFNTRKFFIETTNETYPLYYFKASELFEFTSVNDFIKTLQAKNIMEKEVKSNKVKTSEIISILRHANNQLRTDLIQYKEYFTHKRHVQRFPIDINSSLESMEKEIKFNK